MTTPRDEPGPAGPPLEGRTDPQLLAVQVERGEAGDMELLAGLSDDDFADFALAAAIQRELEEQDAAAATPGVLPFARPERPRRGLDRRWMAAAAVVAGLALVPMAWRATQGGGPVRDPAQAVALLENPSAGLPADWVDNPAWSVTRGGSDPLVDQPLSVRTGADMVALEVAVRARDAEDTRRIAQRVSLTLTEASTVGSVAARSLDPLVERAGAPPADLLSALEEASESVADAVDGDWFAVGAWTEAARLAAARRDAAFFREERTRRTLERVEDLVEDNESARAAVAAIRDAIGATPLLWPELEGALGNLMKAVA